VGLGAGGFAAGAEGSVCVFGIVRVGVGIVSVGVGIVRVGVEIDLGLVG